MTFAVAGRLVVIAVLAAIVAWLPSAVLVTSGMDAELRLGTAFRLLLFALFASFMIGLPVASLFVLFGKSTFAGGYSDIALVGFAAGAVLVIATLIFGGTFGALFIGTPAFLAANIYAALGWFWIFRPIRGGSPKGAEQ